MRVLRQTEFWIILAAAGVLTVGHYTASPHDPFWHDLFRRLYYLPIILAGFRYGFRGGLATAAVIALAFLPHVLMTRGTLHVQASESRFEIPLYLAVGAVTGVLADRQRRSSAALRQTERLKTLGETAAGVAHEIKNPLAAIRSSAQLLGGRLSGRDAELSELIVREVDRLNKVVDDLLRYARPAPLRLEPGRLSQVLAASAELLGPVAGEKRLEIVRDIPEGEPEPEFDRDQLQQVFVNLLLNAIEAVPTGGRIRLGVRTDGPGVLAYVEDNGPGIPTERRQAVFEPFFTTKQGGTGLGLAIARRIVAEHGGRLDLENLPTGGTRASVRLSARSGRK